MVIRVALYKFSNHTYENVKRWHLIYDQKFKRLVTKSNNFLKLLWFFKNKINTLGSEV